MKLIILAFVLLSASVAKAQNSTVTVQVENLKNEKGVCRACLFDDAKSFPGEKEKAVSCKSAKISKGKSTIVFENVSNGKYAISVFHDENNNNDLDENFMGIPREGYGASKNVLPKMSKPSFDDNAFQLKNQAVNLIVKIRY